MNRLDALRSKAWPIVCTVLLLFFGATRLYNLSARPLHHDEGVNGLFMKTLIESNNWKYDPKNYHGPTLYYLQLIPTWVLSYINDGAGSFNPHSVSGLTPVGVRLPIALVGILTLFLILNCWPMLGRVGAASACLFAGASCDLLFYNRYFIHESYMVLFTVIAIFNAYRYRQTKDPFYAYIVGLASTLLFSTKETALFHFGVLIAALVCAKLTKWLADGRREKIEIRQFWDAPNRVLDGLKNHAPVIFAICILFWAMLFSSMLTNFRGPLDSVRSYFFWGAEGVESGHVKPFFYYFTSILNRYEAVLLIFSFIGVILAFVKNEIKGLFLAYWTLGMAAFYSLVPYKTPWLVMDIVLPMTFVAGFGVQTVYDEVRRRLPGIRGRIVLIAFASIGLFLMIGEARETYLVNFVEYDSDVHPQIYAHTLRDIKDMLAKIDAAATRAGGKDAVINIFSDQYWPLPLYLIQYRNARFWGNSYADCKDPDAPILIVIPQLQPQVDARLKDLYNIKTFLLRPGVGLALYTNTNLSDPQGVISRPIDLNVSHPKPANANPGLKLEAFSGVGFATKPEHTVNGDTSYSFSWLYDAEKKYKSPFSLRWTGYINIEKAGQYKFALESDDGSWLTIDDTPVIDNGGDHAVTKLSRAVNLSAGYHKFEMKYYDVLGGAVLHFTWAPPGSAEVPVPAINFVYQPQ